MATLGDGIFAPILDCLAGHDGDPDVQRRFRAWYARVLLEHLERS